MKLYLAPGACSLADHIALHEAGLVFEHVKVDLKTHLTAAGDDFTQVNPKGYVPTLVLDDGEVLTENVAILSWIADKIPSLAPSGPMARHRLLETLAYISTEVHKAFKPLLVPDAAESDRVKARDLISRRLAFLGDRLHGDYLFGDTFTVADAYLFVMLMWAGRNGITMPRGLNTYFERVKGRNSVKLALKDEGLA